MKTKTFHIEVLLLLVSASLMAQTPQQHTNNGTDAVPFVTNGANIDITKVPYQVAILLDGSQNCGGSIIGNRWILTAKHCTKDYFGINYSASRLSILSGTTTLNHPRSSTAKMYSVREIIRHPTLDIALLQLNETIIYNQATQKIPLNTQQDNVRVGLTGRVTGWGWTIPGDPNSKSNILQFVDVPIISNDEANSLLENANFFSRGVTNDEIATGPVQANRLGACHGDSGGPLVVNGVLVGVVSWGIPNCIAGINSPSVYVNVMRFRRWIEAAMTFHASLSGINVSNIARSGRTVSANASGGFPPYDYSWNVSGGSYVGSGTSIKVKPNNGSNRVTIRLTVTDAYGNTKTVSGYINFAPPLFARVWSSTSSPHPRSGAKLSASISGGAPPYSYSWEYPYWNAEAVGSTSGLKFVVKPLYMIKTTSQVVPVTFHVKDRHGTTASSTENLYFQTPLKTQLSGVAFASSLAKSGNWLHITISDGLGPFTVTGYANGARLANSSQTIVQHYPYTTKWSFEILPYYGQDQVIVSAVINDRRGKTQYHKFTYGKPRDLDVTLSGANSSTLLSKNGNWLTAHIKGGKQPYTVSWSATDAVVHTNSLTVSKYVPFEQKQRARVIPNHGKYQTTVRVRVQDKTGKSVTKTVSFGKRLTGRIKYLHGSGNYYQVFSAEASGGILPYSYQWKTRSIYRPYKNQVVLNQYQGKYWYLNLLVTDANGNQVHRGINPFPTLGETGLPVEWFSQEEDIPEETTIESIFPNPTNDQITMRIGFAKVEKVSILIYDLLGRLVKEVCKDKEFREGWYDEIVHVQNFPSGTYFCVVTMQDKRFTNKFMVLK